MQRNILLVDDSEEFTSYFLSKFSYIGNLECVCTHDEALHRAEAKRWDLFFLDHTLDNKKTCFDLIPHVRHHNPRCHIIIVTGYADKAMAIQAVNYGVSGFIEKPVLDDEVRRRLQTIGWFSLTFQLEQRSRALYVGEKSYSLTQVEYVVLELLLSKKNQLVTRKDLEQSIWNGRHVAKNTLDTHLYNLKRKVPELKNCLSSIHGTGYLLKIQ